MVQLQSQNAYKAYKEKVLYFSNRPSNEDDKPPEDHKLVIQENGIRREKKTLRRIRKTTYDVCIEGGGGSPKIC